MSLNDVMTQAERKLAGAGLADSAAVAAPASMLLSLGITALTSKLQADVLTSVVWVIAVGSACCHAWFAWLRTKLVISLYQYLSIRWGSSKVPALGPVRHRARGLMLGAIMAWIIAGLQLVWAMALNVKYVLPITLGAYSILIGMSAAYSLAFLHSHKSLRAQIHGLRSVPSSCRVGL